MVARRLQDATVRVFRRMTGNQQDRAIVDNRSVACRGSMSLDEGGSVEQAK